MINFLTPKSSPYYERVQSIVNKMANTIEYPIMIYGGMVRDMITHYYEYNFDNWNRGIQFLNQKYKIVTTKKVNENVLCTRDDNLKIKDIASISTKVKVVIAINTGPLIVLLNKFTLMSVKKFYIFDNRVYLDYPNFEMKRKLKDISLKELDDYTTNTL